MENIIYNPANQSKESLIESFVVRHKVFEKIFKDIKSAEMKYPEQHYLIQGQRGMGKTTLLLRLKYEVENTPELSNWLVPVFFNEESYDLTSLSNLWEKLLRYLDELWNIDGEYYNHSEAFLNLPDYEKKCFDYLIEILKEKNKKLLIFFDNFGQLFLDNLKEKEKRRLREILMDCNDIRIIGASAIVISDLHDYSQPFFEFFKIIPLEGLDKNETYQLISKLQEIDEVKIDLKKNKSKIETLSILTGGVIRTLMLVYEVILSDQDGSALRDLELVLDRITPLYKHRVEDLPVQQRKIIDVMAKQWDAVSTKDIASHIREDGKSMSTKLISAQLQQLERNNVIEKKLTNTKNHLYQVKERFFNIWYLMRHGDRKDKRKVKWLTKFLELWYDDEEDLDGFIKRYIELLRSGKYHAKSALLLSEALVNCEAVNVLKLDTLIDETSAILDDNERKLLPNVSSKKLLAAIRLQNEEKYNESIEILESISDRDSKMIFFLARAYIEKQDKARAFEVLESINDVKDKDCISIATLYIRINHHQKSLAILDKYKGDDRGAAYLMKGISYYSMGQIAKAKDFLKSAIIEHDVHACKLLGTILKDEGDYEAAEKVLLDGIKFEPGIYKDLLGLYLLGSSGDRYVLRALEIINNLNEKEIKSDPDVMVFKAMVTSLIKGEQGGATFEPKEIKLLRNARKLYNKNVKGGGAYFIMQNILMTDYLFYNKNKLEAERMLKEYIYDNPPKKYELYESFLLAWNSRYQNAADILFGYDISDLSDWDNDLFNDTLLLLMSRRQYHLVLDVFNKKENLKDILKPTYYALMSFLIDEYPNESIRMGKELEEPVSDILKRSNR